MIRLRTSGGGIIDIDWIGAPVIGAWCPNCVLPSAVGGLTAIRHQGAVRVMMGGGMLVDCDLRTSECLHLAHMARCTSCGHIIPVADPQEV